MSGDTAETANDSNAIATRAAPDRVVPVAATAIVSIAWVAWIVVLGVGRRQRVVGFSNSESEPLQHLVGFAVLGALVAILVRSAPVAIVATLIILGLLGEVVQLVGDDRSFSLLDLSMDALGAAVGVALVHLSRHRTSVVVSAHAFAVVLLVSSPWLLENSTPNTSFPERCAPAPPPVDAEPELLLEVGGLPSDDLPIPVETPLVRRLRRALVRTNELTVETRFETTNLDQVAPVFTISDGPGDHQVSVHVGQRRDDLVVRLRTSCELFNEVVVADVIRAARPHHAVATWSSGELVVWLDGAVAAREPLPWGDFDRWSLRHGIVVGGESGGGSTFEGTVRSVAMWDVALSDEEIQRRSDSG